LQKSHIKETIFCKRDLYFEGDMSHLSVKITPFNAVVSFAKEPYKTDDILQKRPILWK